MHTFFLCFTAFAACGLVTSKGSAQSAKDIRGSSPLLAIENEPAPKLIADPPTSGTAVARSRLHPVQDRKSSRGAGVRKRCSHGVAPHRTYPHYRGRFAVALCRCQRGNYYSYWTDAGASQSAHRTGRSNAQSNHQRNGEVYCARYENDQVTRALRSTFEKFK